ncbi:MAG TPA: hypothetical protein VK864_08680 [Longimicrobiales bacterium]|nr:hypothetical protein [Longimicrobiales bacterium]
MRSILVGAAVFSAVLVAAQSSEAQIPRSTPISVTRGSFAVAPYAGYLISESFIEGPLNTSLGTVNAPVYGVQASLPLAPSFSLVGTVGYASGDLEVGLPVLGGIAVGNSDTWVLDAAVELRPDGWEEQGKRFIPVVHLGGGALNRKLEVLGVSASTTDFMVSAGLGADFPLTSNMSIRIMAKDHYGKADFGSVGQFSAKTDDLHTVALSGGLRISF